jgi:two-component system NarL family sensor kinase
MEPSLSEFTIMFSIATMGMVVLALAIVFFVLFYQRKMLEAKLQQQKLEVENQEKMLLATLESQENERQRLSRDLHDSIGLMLSTIRVIVHARQEQQGNTATDQLKTMIDDTIDSVRRISRDLMPPSLQRFGFCQAVRDMCNQYASLSQVRVELNQTGLEVDQDKSREIMLFRIVQELVNNALKHSNSPVIRVSIHWKEMLVISVEDEGVGFNVHEKKNNGSGLGLFNMQNRAKILGATFEYENQRERGTLATVCVPIFI